MGMFDEILNQKARMEEFTPDLVTGVIAGSAYVFRAYCRKNGFDALANPLFGPSLREVPRLPSTAFATETSCYLLVVDVASGKAVKVDKKKVPMIDFDSKVGAILVALGVMEVKGDQP